MSEAGKQQSPVVFGIIRKSLEATVIYACPHCGAPGVYRSDDHTREHWPGCWRLYSRGEPVGDNCPNCGKWRRPNKDLGELTASMPKWMWNCILAFKWCLIKLRGIGARHASGLHGP